jgi:hypothetical protein
MSKNLQLVRPPSPKQNKRFRDVERYRVLRVYESILMDLRAKDQDQIRQFAKKYKAFPAMASKVYTDALLEFPTNVLCQAQDSMRITSIITGAFQSRNDLHLINGNRKGGTWDFQPSVQSKPFIAVYSTPQPVQSSTEGRLDRIESTLEKIVTHLKL